jgi:hypothetical protein
MNTPEWLTRAPKMWQVLAAFVGVAASGIAGSLATARWLGWSDVGPSQRLEALQVHDSVSAATQSERDAGQDVAIGALDLRLGATKDSLFAELTRIRQAQAAGLRLQCVQSPEIYQRLADVRCPKRGDP